MESGKPKRLTLQPGECHIPDENDHIELLGYPRKQMNQSQSYEDSIDRSRVIGPVYNVDDEYRKPKNSSDMQYEDVTEELTNLAWPQNFNENSLEREPIDESRSLTDNKDTEIFEPILKSSGKRSNVPSSREAHALRDIDREISEPILRSTTQRIQHQDDYDDSKRVTGSSKLMERQNGVITIQLFPFRIGEILDRAERYARLTLLPLLTEQAPRFFGFDNPSPNRETTKFFSDFNDRDDDEDFDDEGEETKPVKRENSRETGNYNYETTSPRNIHKTLRKNFTSKVIQQRSIDPSHSQYYNDVTDMDDDDDEMRAIKISLPTYRPIVFPYLFEIPENLTDETGSVTVEKVGENESDNSTTESFKFIDMTPR